MLLSGEPDDVDIVNNEDENKKMQLILVFFVSIFLSGAPACLVNNPTLALVQVLSLPLSRSPGTI